MDNVYEDQIINGYKVQEFLGKGCFGKVYSAINILSNTKVALKIVNREKIQKSPQLINYLKEEGYHLPKIKNINIIKFYEFFEKNGLYFFVLEYVNFGDLKTYINKKNHNKLEESEAFDFLNQIMNGYKDLMKKDIMHRDLKLENILLNKEEDGKIILKICDFDFLKKGIIGSTYLGTSFYMSPEILNHKIYTNQTDLWALGVIYYKMLFGNFPFIGKTEIELLENIKKENVNFYENDTRFNVSKTSIEFLKQIFVFDFNERLDWEKAFMHPLIRNKENHSKIKEKSEERKSIDNNPCYSELNIKSNSSERIFLIQPKINEIKKFKKIDEEIKQDMCHCFSFYKRKKN